MELLTVGSGTVTTGRALVELCDETPDSALVHEANTLMQGFAPLRPNLVRASLQHCDSVKAKRLFLRKLPHLALAERHRHAWLAHVNLQNVDLGRGKRVLVPGGKLNTKYQITLPANLDDQLG